jgi:hypothetical protein
MHTLPVIHDIDVLVVGASAGAVAAALTARQLGRRALVVSELSYLGEESAGALALQPAGLERTDPLVRAIFPDDAPALPGAVKATLERALLDAGVPYLFLARPVAVLTGDDGGIAGAVIATRTALSVVRCGAIIDATRYGVVARLAGVPLTPRTPPAQMTWTVIADGMPAGWESAAERIDPPFRVERGDEVRDYMAYRLRVDRARLGDDPWARESAWRGMLCDERVLATADILPDPAAVVAGGPARASVDSLGDAQFSPHPGLMVCNGVLPLTADAAVTLERSDVQVALGRRVGALAAALPAPDAICTALTGGDARGDFRFAPAFFRREVGTVTLDTLTFPSLGTCDVLVAGGGTGGAPAGIAAARAGARTVVLEAQHALGGVGTLGLISRYWFGNRVGFTAELDTAVMALDRQARDEDGCSWSPEVKSAVYHRMLHAAGGAAWLGSYAFGVRMDGDRVSGVLVSTPFGGGLLEVGGVVDATGNADIAAAAGAPCRVIDAEHVATQGTGLSPRVFPGVRYQNSDHTFIEETDPEGITHAFSNARGKFSHDFDTSPLVNSRERRQILGDVEVSPLDILARRTFPDTVVIARSNFDTHGFIVHPLFMIAAPDHDPLEAHVPFRCMLPRGVEGVLVIGLGMSAHRDALPVLRMQPDVQNQGYAAGLAAAMRLGQPLRGIDMRALQQALVKVGNLSPEVLTHDDSFPMDDAVIRRAAADRLTALMPAAILLAHPAQSQPLLRSMLADPARGDDAALLLGLMGDPAAGPRLVETVRAAAWDEGWNFRGMGQFGPSMSRLDATILALARTGAPEAATVIAEKVAQLPDDPAFSHCRVVGLAGALLRDARLADALAALLGRPGMQGHAQLDSRAVIAAANGDLAETVARNASLRELYLARGLYQAGDRDGVGREILARYADDLRGHYARHARAVLAGAVPALAY